MNRRVISILLAIVLVTTGCALAQKPLSDAPQQAAQGDYDYELLFPSDDYPETALHISGAIEQGYSDVCTIDRKGAEENRKQSLAGIETRRGYDRDEWPMAMCKEGGAGASVAYIASSDNRGAGSWVGHQLSAYEDGTKILFIVKKPKVLFPNQPPAKASSGKDEVSFPNCAAVREAGKAPLRKGDPGYSAKLDRDGDGIACE